MRECPDALLIDFCLLFLHKHADGAADTRNPVDKLDRDLLDALVNFPAPVLGVDDSIDKEPPAQCKLETGKRRMLSKLGQLVSKQHELFTQEALFPCSTRLQLYSLEAFYQCS